MHNADFKIYIDVTEKLSEGHVNKVSIVSYYPLWVIA